MTYAIDTSDDLMAFHPGPRRRSVSSHAIVGVLVLSFSGCLGAWMLRGPLAPLPASDEPPAPAPKAAVATSNAAGGYNVLLDPAFSLGFVPPSLVRTVPHAVTLAALPATPAPRSPAPAEPEVVLPKPAPAAAPLVDSIPLPAPRPPELQARAGQGPVRGLGRAAPPRSRSAAVPAAPADNRSFFERLFGAAPQPAGTVLAYASPEDGLVRNAYRNPPAVAAAPSSDRFTAVYDIEAHTVTLPDGTRLEAHSGLGDRLDDPRYVHERMRGPTPPHVYDLQFREQLFHGVRAIRMNPVGGGGVFGRTGLLAHTYMLGPKGDSNGCVSFRDYDAFVRAFESGQVKRLAVVARSS